MLDSFGHIVYVLHKKFTRLGMTKGNTHVGFGYIEDTKDGVMYHYEDQKCHIKAKYDEVNKQLVLDGNIYLRQIDHGCLIDYKNQRITILEEDTCYTCESETNPLILSISFLFFMMMKEKDELILM